MTDWLCFGIRVAVAGILVVAVLAKIARPQSMRDVLTRAGLSLRWATAGTRLIIVLETIAAIAIALAPVAVAGAVTTLLFTVFGVTQVVLHAKGVGCACFGAAERRATLARRLAWRGLGVAAGLTLIAVAVYAPHRPSWPGAAATAATTALAAALVAGLAVVRRRLSIVARTGRAEELHERPAAGPTASGEPDRHSRRGALRLALGAAAATGLSVLSVMVTAGPARATDCTLECQQQRDRFYTWCSQQFQECLECGTDWRTCEGNLGICHDAVFRAYQACLEDCSNRGPR